MLHFRENHTEGKNSQGKLQCERHVDNIEID